LNLAVNNLENEKV